MVGETKRFGLEKKGFDPPANIAGDPLMLRIAVRNVLNNAFDFSPTGGSIDLEIRERESSLMFW